MSLSELLLTLIVGLLVFGPKKLPQLATHLGKLFRFLNDCKEQIHSLWKKQLDIQQLNENQIKAKAADVFYDKNAKKMVRKIK